MFTLGFEFQQAFKAADTKTFCPAASPAVTECATGAAGGPADKEKELAYLAWRSTLGGYAFSIKFTHDLKNDDTGIDLPIYLVRNADGLLNAGIRFGWTDTDALAVGVFAGSGFKLFE